MRPRAVALVVAGLLGSGVGVPSTALGQAGLRYGVRLEAGGEYDSNPERREEVAGIEDRPIRAAPALRLVSGIDIAAASRAGHLFSLSGEAAGKRFLETDVQGEDLLLLDGRLTADFALSERSRLALLVSHYDALQRASDLPEARDFRSTTPALRFEHRLGGARFAAGGGWRWFTFKPEPMFDFQAPTAFVAYRQALLPPLDVPGAEWDWGLTASFEGRRFQSSRCAQVALCPPTDPTAPQRLDRFVALAADVNRTGDALVGGGVALQINDSNSFGESLLRAAVHLRAAVLLPLDLSLAGRAELVAARYRDAVQVGRDPMTGSFVSIEEEGRSTLRLELLRPLGERFETGVRYTLWTSAPGDDTVSFQRHSFVLFLAVTFAP